MGIRDALAAEGNAPLVFMGGTCAGPKWRERLCGQVSQSFRWFNPVVDEWSEEAKEAELAVRAEADVMLYAITPYQEGCYSYLEMTEDAIRSEKPVVIAFLPSFEDKAFSEQQWSSIVSAKRLLERNNATVLLSMEELIDWFNRYNATSPDSKMLDTTELLRKAATEEKTVEHKGAPVTAAGLVNAVQEERAAEFAKPANEEPGTTPAAGDAGTSEVKPDGTPSVESHVVSRGGIGEWLIRLFGGRFPGEYGRYEKKLDLGKAMDALEDTLGDVDWVASNLNKSKLQSADLTFFAINGKLSTNPGSDLSRVANEIKSYTRKCQQQFARYNDQLWTTQKKLIEQYRNDELADDALDAAVYKGFSTITLPYPVGSTIDSWVGESTAKFVESTDEYETTVTKRKVNISASQLTPAILAAYARGVIKYGQEIIDTFDKWTSDDEFFIGIDATEYFWRSNALTDKTHELGNLHHSDSGATAMVGFCRRPIHETIDAMSAILNIVNQVTGSQFGKFYGQESLADEDLTVSAEGIFDGLVGLVRGYADEDSPGDDKDGKKLMDFSWADKQKEAITRTFGNEKWVRANFKPGAKIDAKLAARLALGGKVLKPAEGYSRGRDLVDSFINKVMGPMTAYDRALKDLESEAAKRIEKGEDGPTVAKDILARAMKIKPPIPNNYTTDEFVGGYVLRFNQNTDNIKRMTIEITPKGELPVPELTVDDIIAAGKQLVNVGNDIDILLRKAPMAGSGCDVEPWTIDGSGFDYDSDTGEDLQEIFYFQADPDVFNDFCNEPVFLLAGYIRQVGRWLQTYTR